MGTVRWGILSTARIAEVLVPAARGSDAADIAAVASRTEERARAFAAEHGIAHAFGSYEALLASPEVDAVYIALPTALHAEWVVKALAAGKHVLCEKPFAPTPEEVAHAFEVAERAGLVCAEGFMWRYHPQSLLARRLVEEGAIGTLKQVRAALTVRIEKNDIRRVRALGGGAVLDLGGYCVSAARFFAGEPLRVYAEAASEGEEVDMRLAATLRHPGDVLAQFDIGFDLPRRDELELIGTDGRITLNDPWLCATGALTLHREDRTETHPVDPAVDVYRVELDAVSAAISGGTPLPFGAADAVAQARVLQAVLRSAEQAEPIRIG